MTRARQPEKTSSACSNHGEFQRCGSKVHDLPRASLAVAMGLAVNRETATMPRINAWRPISAMASPLLPHAGLRQIGQTRHVARCALGRDQAMNRVIDAVVFSPAWLLHGKNRTAVETRRGPAGLAVPGLDVREFFL